MNIEWLSVLNELVEQSKSGVLVTVIEVSGSTPREVGARMIVCSKEEVYLTVGGGELERQAIDEAIDVLQGVSSNVAVEYPLGPRTRQCCGGQAKLLFEPFGFERRLFVFGAGHVGQACADVLLGTNCRLVFNDTRNEWLERLPPNVVKSNFTYEKFIQEFKISSDDSAVIMTHSHELDYEVLCACIKLNLKYLGLIGSESKWNRFRARLEKDGYTPEQISRVVCPIGLVSIGKTPKEIAISFASQWLSLK